MIVDASVALLPFLPELPSPQRQRLAEVLVQATMEVGARAPRLYGYEVGHAVFDKRSRKFGARSDQEDAYRRMLHMVTFEAPAEETLIAVGKLVRPGLSFHDAAYLEMAGRTRDVLVTADHELHVGARRRRIDSFLLPRDLAKMEKRFFAAG